MRPKDLPEKETGVFYVYGLRANDSKEYRWVGQTNNCRRRYFQHFCRTDSNAHKANWILKLKREGKDLIFDVLEKTTQECIDQREIFWMNKLRNAGHSLLNMADGGMVRRGWGHTDGAKTAIRDSLLGRRRSPEVITKISKTLKGHEVSQESRKKISNTLTGQTQSEDHRALTGKISRAAWNSYTPAEKASRIEKMHSARKPWTNEMKAALSAKKIALHEAAGGTPGIWFNVKTGKWQAGVTIDGIRQHLGSFSDKKDAISARTEALK